MISFPQAPLKILPLVGLGRCLRFKTNSYDFMGSNNRGSDQRTAVSPGAG